MPVKKGKKPKLKATNKQSKQTKNPNKNNRPKNNADINYSSHGKTDENHFLMMNFSQENWILKNG